MAVKTVIIAENQDVLVVTFKQRALLYTLVEAASMVPSISVKGNLSFERDKAALPSLLKKLKGTL